MRMVSDRVMTVVVFEEDVLRLICGYSPKTGRSLDKKQSFYDELKCEWDIHSASDLVMCLGDFNRLIGRHIDRGYGVGQMNLEGEMLLGFCLKKKLCVEYTEKTKVTFRIGENETEIDFVLIEKEYTIYTIYIL